MAKRPAPPRTPRRQAAKTKSKRAAPAAATRRRARKQATRTPKASRAKKAAPSRKRRAPAGATRTRKPGVRKTGPTSARRRTAKPPKPRAATPAPPAVVRPRRSRPSPERRRPLPPIPPLADEETEEPLVETPTSFALDFRRNRDARATLEVSNFPADPESAEALAAGDRDVHFEAASTVGDETPGGDNPTPDMDVVDLIGRSLGVEYADHEELAGADKITRRDRKRWELDPKSSEDYKDRSRG